MKVLVVPDVHGSREWESVKSFPQDSYDRIVFMGDYFDACENKWPEQGENFEKICAFVRQDPERRKALLGNHDWSYLSATVHGAGCSGHQNGKASKIKSLLLSARDILDLAFEADGVVFSHGGFSKTWVATILRLFNMNASEWSIDFLNKTWRSLSLQKDEAAFNYEFEELFDWHGYFSGSGNEATQGPLWIRPEALLDDAYCQTQVVGHTECCLGDFVALTGKDMTNGRENIVIATDSKSHQVFGVIDTKKLDIQPMTILEFNKFYKTFFEEEK
ncbi:MAG: metallophosphoesterase [Treponema sp.]|nr:metallophosphoesterase [Treponema sp.]